MIEFHVESDGVAVLTWDVSDRPMNVLNEASIAAFEKAMEKVLSDDAIKGAVITSSHKEFIVGADIRMLEEMGNTAEEIYAKGARIQALFRRLETGGKPFVAAINGHALGGGYELCLACHRRIASEEGRIKIGLPESKLGLLPGGGGTQRLPRLIGIEQAVPLMLEGRDVDQRRALKMGMIDELVPAAELVARARQWVLEQGYEKILQPWDRKGYRIPGGAVQSPKIQQFFIAGNALLREKTYGNYPAQRNIMSCVFEGLQTDLDTGLKIETRYFANCLLSPEAKNMIRFFFSMTDANKLSRRPRDVEKSRFSRIGVLGAGMMGAGIAYVTAAAGLEVVLIDTTLETAEKGRDYSRTLVEKQLKRGRLTQAAADALLGRIHPTTDFADLAGCELVIEAVFEDRAIKADVTARAEAVVGEDAVFASNTSTLPITGLAEASRRPEMFIGLHFFSPVEKMPLVEIIRGRETGTVALARAMDFVRTIGKTPIVVNDSRGFFTSRVFATYVREGLAMLAEGVKPALIENAGRMAGMPVGPLALADEVSIELMYKIMKQTKADLGDAYVEQPGDDVIVKWVEELGRIGKKAGKGFYEYPQDGAKYLWPGIGDHYPLAASQPEVQELMQRMLYIQALESARCMEEGVVEDPRDADVGSVMGWGFPPFHGGVASLVDEVGADIFVARCEGLAQKYGARFSPPQSLRDLAAAAKGYYGRAA